MTRHTNSPLLRGVFFLVFIAALLPADAKADATVDAVGMTVSNLDRSVAFYTQVLSFTPHAEINIPDIKRRIVRLRLGEDAIELAEPHLTDKGEPAYEPSTSDDQFFHLAVRVRDIKKARKHLRKQGVRFVDKGPSWLDQGGIKSLTFEDPDRHRLLIVEYPENRKGPKGHRHPKELFLAIDHVAIPLMDSNAGLRFYRDGVGLELEEGEVGKYSSGVTMFRPKKGPRIACLEGAVAGPAKPLSRKVSEIKAVRWQTRIKTSDIGHAVAALQGEVVYQGFLSILEEGILRFKWGVVVRDPDGHAVELIQE